MLIEFFEIYFKFHSQFKFQGIFKNTDFEKKD